MAFENFPIVEYESNKFIRDYYFRIKFVDNYVKNNVAKFTPYIVEYGDTPESLSMKFYGTDIYWYMILIVNEIFDPFYEWQMTDEEMMNYAIKYVDENLYNLSAKSVQIKMKKIITDGIKLLLKNYNVSAVTTTYTIKMIKELVTAAGGSVDEHGNIVFDSSMDDKFIEELSELVYNKNTQLYWDIASGKTELNDIINIQRRGNNKSMSDSDVENFFKQLSLTAIQKDYTAVKEMMKDERDRLIDKIYTQQVEKNRLTLEIPNTDYIATLHREWNNAVSRAISAQSV